MSLMVDNAEFKISPAPESELAPASESPRKDVSPISLIAVREVLCLVEAGIVFLSALLAKLIYINGFLQSGQATLPYAYVGLLGAVLSLFVFRMLDSDGASRLRRLEYGIRKLTVGLGVCMLALLCLFYLFKVSQEYSRGWMLTWAAVAWLAICIERAVATLYIRALTAEGRLVQRVAIYGSDPLVHDVHEELSRHASFRVVGVYEDTSELRLLPDASNENQIEDLISLGQDNEIDRVIVALPPRHTNRLARILAELSVLPQEVDLCTDVFKLPCESFSVQNVGGVRFYEVLRPPIGTQGYLAKSVLDVTLATVGFVLALPLLLVLAAAIKLDSRGPVIFVQRRHGYNHEVINVYKFRTMSVMQDGAEVVQASKDDVRVTRVGRFLRRTSLDELPQLINVLKREMSLVGPRPHALAHNDYYSSQVERYANRHRVKPGITGWAQVKGYRGETRETEMMRKRVEHDLWYINNWSVLFDIEIMFRTLLIVFTGRNAH